MHPVVKYLGTSLVAAGIAGVFGVKSAEYWTKGDHNAEGVTFPDSVRSGTVADVSPSARQKVTGFARKVFRNV